MPPPDETPPQFSFAHTVFREIDLIRSEAIRELASIKAGIEKAVEKLERRDEERDQEVSDLKLQVGLLREECRRNLKRDAGLVLAPTTITAVVTAIITALGSPDDPPRPPRRAPVVQVEPAPEPPPARTFERPAGVPEAPEPPR